jgi:general secretion pathway protein A
VYYSYFGLREAPFSIAVNPRYLYMSPAHRDALAHLLYGIGAGGGFILLTGEVGTGKTTINRCLLEQLPDTADLAVVLNPALEAAELLAAVCDELDIRPEGETPGLKAYSDALHRFLLANHARGRKTVLMIDEAQHLSFDALEQIRLLTNLETSEEKLLHIILTGQPELAERLRRPELRQLNQRITARFELSPLTPAETAAYIRHRLNVAGLPAGRELFPRPVLRAIHRRSAGIPRRINLLCDRMLLGAYGRDSQRLDGGLLRAAAREVMGEEVAARTRSPLYAALGGLTLLVAAIGFALTRWEDAEFTPAPGNPPAIALSPQAPEAIADAPGAAAPRTALLERDWLLSPGEGVTLFASLYGLDVRGALDPCSVDGLVGLECEASQPQTWEPILDEARPALLELVDERRFSRRGVFLGRDGEVAVLASRAGETRRVPFDELATLWSGRVWHLWQRPPDIQRTLARGDSGPDVNAAARLFARADGEEGLLTDTDFNARLEQRVRLFQQSQGLEADGVLGTRTLRALVLMAGEDLSREAARQRLRRLERSAPTSGAGA